MDQINHGAGDGAVQGLGEDGVAGAGCNGGVENVGVAVAMEKRGDGDEALFCERFGTGKPAGRHDKGVERGGVGQKNAGNPAGHEEIGTPIGQGVGVARNIGRGRDGEPGSEFGGDAVDHAGVDSNSVLVLIPALFNDHKWGN